MFARYLDYWAGRVGLTVRILAGILVWLVVLILQVPEPTSQQWGEMLLLLAALLLLPMSFEWLVPLPGRLHYRLWQAMHLFQFPAAVALVAAFYFPPGVSAFLWAMPWCLELIILASFGVWILFAHRWRGRWNWCRAVGAFLTVVGGVWLLCDRIGYRPLDFDAEIVLLTAIHFHYAAYLLPLGAGLLVRVLPTLWTKLAATGALVGVPLVASGITVTHLFRMTWLELLATTLLAMDGGVIGIGHTVVAWRYRAERVAAGMLFVAGMALIVTMALAALYGWRHYLVAAALDIPQMRKWHGSMAVLGFALLALPGWRKLRVSTGHADAVANTY